MNVWTVIGIAPFNWPRIRYDESVAIIGPKGSGKSELLALLLRTKHNAVLLDTKKASDVEHWDRVGTILENAADIWRIRNGRFVYPVPASFLDDEGEGAREQSHLFKSLLNTGGPRVIGLDEAFNYYSTLGLKLLALQGRAKRVPLWVAMQRPFGVPLYTLSEADHLFVFGLSLERDRDRIEEWVGKGKVPWAKLERNPHEFVHVARKQRTVSAPTHLRKDALILAGE